MLDFLLELLDAGIFLLKFTAGVILVLMAMATVALGFISLVSTIVTVL